MRSRQNPILSRRAFATGLTGSLAALGVGGTAPARSGSANLDNAILRDAALRGLARAGDVGDPILAAKAHAVLVELENTAPEDAALVRIYRLYDVASAGYHHSGSYRNADEDEALASNLAALHAAVHDRRAVSFHYIDLAGEMTVRSVLPLAIVHPPQGVKLLAWCGMRQDYRQFFIRKLSNLTLRGQGFADRRLTLLQAFAENAATRT